MLRARLASNPVWRNSKTCGMNAVVGMIPDLEHQQQNEDQVALYIRVVDGWWEARRVEITLVENFSLVRLSVSRARRLAGTIGVPGERQPPGIVRFDPEESSKGLRWKDS